MVDINWDYLKGKKNHIIVIVIIFLILFTIGNMNNKTNKSEDIAPQKIIPSETINKNTEEINQIIEGTDFYKKSISQGLKVNIRIINETLFENIKEQEGDSFNNFLNKRCGRDIIPKSYYFGFEDEKLLLIDKESLNVVCDEVWLFNFSSVNLNNETVNRVLEDKFDNIKDIQLTPRTGSGNLDGKSIIVTLYKETSWNERSFIINSLKDSLEISNILFNNSNVEYVKVKWEIPMTDKYGNTESEIGFRVDLEKETAAKINFDGLIELIYVDYEDVLEVLDGYYIHPGLIAGMN